jgi:hypothetical protein
MGFGGYFSTVEESRPELGALTVCRTFVARLVAAAKITMEFEMFEVGAMFLVKIRETVVFRKKVVLLRN